MTILYANRVREVCSATGSLNLTLQGAVSGFASFTSKIPTGSKVPYVLLDGNGVAWEVGIGTLASATELQRTTVRDSSATADRVNSEDAGTPVKISLSTNQHEVFIGTAADLVFSKDENGQIADPSAIRASLFVDTIADMTALTSLVDGESVIVAGSATLGDGLGGIYYWDAEDAGAENPPESYEHDTEATGLFKRVQIDIQGLVRDGVFEIDAAQADTTGASLYLFFRKKATAATAWARWVADYAASKVSLGIRYGQSSAEKFFAHVYSIGDSRDRFEVVDPIVLPTRANANDLYTRALTWLSSVSELALSAATPTAGQAASYYEIPRTKGGYLFGVYETIAALKAVDAAAMANNGVKALVLGISAIGDCEAFYVAWNATSSASGDDLLVFRPSTGSASSGDGRWLRRAVNGDMPLSFGCLPTNAAATNDTAFSAMRTALGATFEIDLGRRVYPVTAKPSGPYRNGWFSIDNADGAATVLYPQRDTHRVRPFLITDDDRYNGWPCDNAVAYQSRNGPIVSLIYSQSAQHGALDHKPVMAFSKNGGQSFPRRQILNDGRGQGARQTFASCIGNGQYFRVDRLGSSPYDHELYSKRIAEYYEDLEATVVTTMGSGVVEIRHANHGCRVGDLVNIVTFSSAIDGITPSGFYEVTGVNANGFQITTTGSGSAGASATRTLSIDYLETQWRPIAFSGGDNLSDALQTFSGSWVAPPTEFQGMAYKPTSGDSRGRLVIGFAGGSGNPSGAHVMVIEDPLDDANIAITRVTSLNGNTEPNFDYHAASDTFFFATRQQDNASDGPIFGWSDDDFATIDAYEEGPNGYFAETNNISIANDGVNVYMLTGGDRKRLGANGDPGRIPIYWMRATIANAKANLWDAFEIIQISDCWRGDAHGSDGANGVGQPSMCYINGQLFCFWMTENAQTSLDAGEKMTPDIHACVIDLRGESSVADATGVAGGVLAAYPYGSPPRPLIMSASDSLLDNRTFEIADQGTSQSTDGVKSINRWGASFQGSTGTWEQIAFTQGQLDGPPGEPRYYGRLTVSGSPAADVGFWQDIESVRTLAGQRCLADLWLRAPNGAGEYEVLLTQKFGSGGSPSADREHVVTVRLQENVWTRVTPYYQIDDIANKTIGTTVDTSSLRLEVRNPRSETFVLEVANADLWGAPPSYPPDFIMPRSRREEKARCARWFRRFTVNASQIVAMGHVMTTTTANFLLLHGEMRKRDPALTFSAATSFRTRSGTGGAITCTAIDTVASIVAPPDRSSFKATVASGLTVGQGCQLEAVSNNQYIDVSCEY